MNKKALLIAALLSALLFTVVAGTTLVHLVKANPFYQDHRYICSGVRNPDENTKPPIISFSSENDTVYGADVVSLSLNVSIGDSLTAFGCVLEKIYYKTDWQSNTISVYDNDRDYQFGDFYTFSGWGGFTSRLTTNFYPSSKMINEFSETINFTGIPDGNHTFVVYAVESGKYDTGRTKQYFEGLSLVTEHYYNSFTITSSSLIRFSVDTTPPEVSVFSPENKTYYSPEALLNFTVSEKSSRLFYSLDGQKNRTVTCNTTLSTLPRGEHYITVYATDYSGNTGTSEIIYFSVAEPFPTTMVIAPIASIGFVGIGLLFYFRKRKH